MVGNILSALVCVHEIIEMCRATLTFLLTQVDKEHNVRVVLTFACHWGAE